MKPTAARQRREAHRTRLAFGRALHQLLAMRRPWMHAWRRGHKPGPIKLPRMVRHHKKTLYRAFMRA